MSHLSIWHWMIVLVLIGLPVALLLGLGRLLKAGPDEVANTWKGRTFFYAALALLFPLWLITLPLFSYLAYRSYKAGRPASSTHASPIAQVASVPPSDARSVASQISELHELLKSGALTQDEFEEQKRKVLAA
ncbi:SHOCT domain-containing protein [Noviherbaspirillum galbum]|uniref:SHOCT domain-containing protein n=1 Tax=Noviherbaspirillum galbum TaxID=2709383 RepID=A0A6B3SWP0_9BURK|nr:SHOCT domain-containing protein [Noviherbaspirillum galbum]NEX63406.1 hypothetical protein [Noviherbaspirillum galbum]